MHMSQRAAIRGFTLIELSIVLLIVAFIVAGLLIGRTMIQQSEVMGVIVDEQKYVKAALSFRDKYNALPGDMTNATSYWGVNPLGCPNAQSSNVTTTTCNGSGSGFITGPVTGNSNGGLAVSNEGWAAWVQLADAGFIQGQYTGQSGTGCWTAPTPGLNVPAGRLPGSGFQWEEFLTSNTLSSGTNAYTQYLIFGGTPTHPCNDLVTAVLTPADAFAIDTKIDDGLPRTGKLLTIQNGYDYTTSCQDLYTNTYSKQAPVGIMLCAFLFEVDW